LNQCLGAEWPLSWRWRSLLRSAHEKAEHSLDRRSAPSCPFNPVRANEDSITVRPRIAASMGVFARHPRGSPYPKEIRLSITQFTFEQAVDVWMRHFSGQYQHQIVAAYVINPRAVNHVLKEKTHVGSKQVAEARFNKSA
jgi:hypothetical protein